MGLQWVCIHLTVDKVVALDACKGQSKLVAVVPAVINEGWLSPLSALTQMHCTVCGHLLT